MSRGHELVTMEFLGVQNFLEIQKSKKRASEINYCIPFFNDKCTQIVLPIDYRCNINHGALQHLMPQLSDQEPLDLEAASIILKELFPQHTDHGSNPTAEQNIATFGNTSIARSANYTTPPGKQSGAAQLTIFYNGMVNVYHVSEKQAEDIIRLAGNEISSQQLHFAGFDLRTPSKPITISSTSTSNQTEEPLPLNPLKNSAPQQVLIQKLHTDLPLQRKQSLERFLHNRKKNRTNRAAPYSRSHAAKN